MRECPCHPSLIGTSSTNGNIAEGWGEVYSRAAIRPKTGAVQHSGTSKVACHWIAGTEMRFGVVWEVDWVKTMSNILLWYINVAIIKISDNLRLNLFW